jgi:hypothetical protein
MRYPVMQLSIKSLLLVIAFIGVTFYLLRILPVDWAFLLAWFLALISIPVAWRNSPPDPPNRTQGLTFWVMFGTAILTELYASQLAYYTKGETESMRYYLWMWFNVFALLVFSHKYKYGCVLLVLLWLSYVPYQLFLLARWTVLDKEVRSIVTQVKAQKLQTGAYPSDLHSIPFNREYLRKDILYTPMGREFIIQYHLGSQRNAHQYYSGTGKGYSYSVND